MMKTIKLRPHEDDLGDLELCDDENNNQAITNCENEEQDDGELNEALGDVFRVRLLLSLTFIVGALAVSFTTASFFTQKEQGKYQDAFLDDAATLKKHIGIRASQNLNSLASFGTSLSTLAMATAAIDNNATWPFVMSPDFEIRGHDTLGIIDSNKLFHAPLVHAHDREAWETFATQVLDPATTYIYKIDPATGQKIPEDHFHDAFYPIAQVAPTESQDIMFNLASVPGIKDSLIHLMSNKQAVLVPIMGNVSSISSWVVSSDENDVGLKEQEPTTLLLMPVYDDAIHLPMESRNVVGVMGLPFLFQSYLTSVFSGGTVGMTVVIESTCHATSTSAEGMYDGGKNEDLTYTYEVNEHRADYLGKGDLHLDYYSDESQSSEFAGEILGDIGFSTTADGTALSETFCPHVITMYPSARFQNHHMTKSPVEMTIFVVLIFSCSLLIFLYFGSYTARRLEVMGRRVAHTNKLVNKLFPKEIRERMFRADGGVNEEVQDPIARIKALLKKEKENETPICDLWPDCTVIFADISGFTAWSSQRDPGQVFALLESVYNAFDQRANARGVFKVETIGDCYVAVTGLPKPRKDHAVVMAHFARDCLVVMEKLKTKLAVTLGPDTADLNLRIGMNSGPVTAGVLRGLKGRFQLFGDTVNVAARIETHGGPGRIHASSSTAELLIAAGKEHWLERRQATIDAKGKGQLNSFWVNIKSADEGSQHSSAPEADSAELEAEHSKIARLVDWNVDVLSQMISRIVAHRDVSVVSSGPSSGSMFVTELSGNILSEVQEVVEIGKYGSLSGDHTFKEKPLEQAVVNQLRQFIHAIGSLYQQNAFHNFEHACHVTMSVTKMLKRIVAPTREVTGISLHDQSFGLSSDPLAQFACVFAAIAHDVDHPGVPNTQLIKEGAAVALFYGNKSVAEQNSVEIAWSLFSDDNFADLRRAICATDDEARRFRQLVVNGIMATDIMDKDLKKLRNERWDKAFMLSDDKSKLSHSVVRVRPNNNNNNNNNNHASNVAMLVENTNRCATIVIEVLLQASDVAHTMQHWHVYRKWNERLFLEMRQAYRDGRADKDPADFWYQGEIGFFDHYIIPLAQKLRECGVFGVSSDEYLTYAKANRREWCDRGQEIVAEMVNLSSSTTT